MSFTTAIKYSLNQRLWVPTGQIKWLRSTAKSWAWIDLLIFISSQSPRKQLVCLTWFSQRANSATNNHGRIFRTFLCTSEACLTRRQLQVIRNSNNSNSSRSLLFQLCCQWSHRVHRCTKQTLRNIFSWLARTSSSMTRWARRMRLTRTSDSELAVTVTIIVVITHYREESCCRRTYSSSKAKKSWRKWQRRQHGNSGSTADRKTSWFRVKIKRAHAFKRTSNRRWVGQGSQASSHKKINASEDE